MHKFLFVLLLVLGLATMAFAQSPADAARSNMQPGFYGEATGTNSQYIYIRVTLAGLQFMLSNGDWQIGDSAGTWYGYLGNEYHSAGGRWAGALPPSFINPGIHPYDSTFKNDCPIIWNQGGVALDFMLAVSSMQGWYYDSKHSSNRLVNEAVTSHDAFQNAMQVRAVFCRYGNGAQTSHYNDLNYAGRFRFPSHNMDPFPVVDSTAVPAYLINSDVVYTTGLVGGIAGMTHGWGVQGAQNISWYEATSYRFNPNLPADSMDLVIGATPKGLGLAPDRRVTIAMELLTPRKVTRAYYTDGYLQSTKTIKLRVWGTPSDATE
jgi:hypothetical protein